MVYTIQRRFTTSGGTEKVWHWQGAKRCWTANAYNAKSYHTKAGVLKGLRSIVNAGWTHERCLVGIIYG